MTKSLFLECHKQNLIRPFLLIAARAAVGLDRLIKVLEVVLSAQVHVPVGKYFQRESCRGCKQIEGMSMNMDELSKSTIWGNNKQLSNKESRLRACLSCQHGSWNSPRCSCCRQNLAEDFYSRDGTGFQQQPTSKRAACPHRHLLDVVSIGQSQILFVNESIFLNATCTRSTLGPTTWTSSPPPGCQVSSPGK